MKRPIFANNQIYHIYNRGVEKRKIFIDSEDYLRFIHDLYEFNDTKPVSNLNYYFKKTTTTMEVGLPKMEKSDKEPRKLLVEILIFCLMPNHFHLMVRQKLDKGITLFMQKLGTGYTNYFNQKYKRVGPLFQGKYKAVHITNESQFLYLPLYIHLNPLEMKYPDWKENGIEDAKEALNFLKQYRWSSFLDYIGVKNFPSITHRDFLLRIFESYGNYQKDIASFIKSFNINKIGDITLES